MLFNEFYDIEIKRIIERREIESNVRFKIDQLFSEEGLVIAFPQRDIHLDTPPPTVKQRIIDHQHGILITSIGYDIRLQP